jgi:hypothetical protein
MTYALTNDGFQVCISLTNVASSRKAQTAMNTTMNIIYYGSQNISTVGTLNFNKAQPRSSSAGMIAGAVIGSVLGCCLLIVVAAFMIFAVTWTKRIVNVKKPRRPSFEMLNSPNLDQEPVITDDIEQPIDTPVDEQENNERKNMTATDDKAATTETITQADNQVSSENEQAIVTQDTPIVDNMAETKPEIATGEILLDLSDNHVETISPSISSDNSIEQEEGVIRNIS